MHVRSWLIYVGGLMNIKWAIDAVRIAVKLAVMYCVSCLDTSRSLYDLGHFALPKVHSLERCI